jgi:hypothetical protein
MVQILLFEATVLSTSYADRVEMKSSEINQKMKGRNVIGWCGASSG